MNKLLKIVALTLAMTLFVVQPAHAFAQFLAPLLTKIVEQITQSGAASSRPRQPSAPLTPEEVQRGVPQGTLTGTMSPPKGRLVLMDGEVKRLAPGSRMYDSKNRIVLPARIQGEVKVRYTTDYLGNIANIWLLSDPSYASTVARRSGNDDEPVAIARSEDRR